MNFMASRKRNVTLLKAGQADGEELEALLLATSPATPMTPARNARIYGKLKRQLGRPPPKRTKI